MSRFAGGSGRGTYATIRSQFDAAPAGVSFVFAFEGWRVYSVNCVVGNNSEGPVDGALDGILPGLA